MKRILTILLFFACFTCSAQRKDLMAKDSVHKRMLKTDAFYRRAYDSLYYWETRYVKSGMKDMLADRMRWYYKFREKSRNEFLADSIFRPSKRTFSVPNNAENARGGPFDGETEIMSFTNHHIINEIPAEYKMWHQIDDSTVWAINNGSSLPVKYNRSDGGAFIMKFGVGAFNYLVGLDDTGQAFHAPFNFNTDPSTNMYQWPTDTTNSPFTGNWFVDAYGQMQASIRADSSVWYWGVDYYNFFYTGGDPLLETGVTMRPTQLSPAGTKFIKVVFGGNCLMGLEANGTVVKWLQNGSRTPTTLSTPRAAVDIFASHLDVQGAIVPDPGETSGLGYPYIMGSGWAMWGGSTTLSSLTSIKSLWNMTSPVREIKCNWNTIHYIDSLGKLFGCGFNSQGEVGNGNEFIGKYTYPTFPAYIWPFNDFENPSGIAAQIGSSTNWKHIYSNNWYAFFWYALDNNDSAYSWGRNKTGNLGNGLSPDFILAPSNSNCLDILSPTMVHPFQSLFQSYSTLKVAVVNCPNQTVHGTSATLTSFDTATLVAVKPLPSVNGIDTVNYGPVTSYLWSVTAKPSGAPTPTLVTPTAQSTSITGLVPGNYTITKVITDSHSGSQIGTMTLTVLPATGLGPIPRGSKIIVL